MASVPLDRACDATRRRRSLKARQVRFTLNANADARDVEDALLSFVSNLAIIAADLYAEGAFALGSSEPAVA